METSVRIACEELPDGILIRQASEGNEEAFEILVRRYREALFRLVYNSLGNYHTTYDMLQHVFLQLYVSLKKIQTDTSLKAWLFQVARHRCYDELRKKRVAYFSELESVRGEEEDPVYEGIADPDSLVEELVEKHEMQEALQNAIAKLPQKYRNVVLLRYRRDRAFPRLGNNSMSQKLP